MFSSELSYQHYALLVDSITNYDIRLLRLLISVTLKVYIPMNVFFRIMLPPLCIISR